LAAQVSYIADNKKPISCIMLRRAGTNVASSARSVLRQTGIEIAGELWSEICNNAQIVPELGLKVPIHANVRGAFALAPGLKSWQQGLMQGHMNPE